LSRIHKTSLLLTLGRRSKNMNTGTQRTIFIYKITSQKHYNPQIQFKKMPALGMV